MCVCHNCVNAIIYVYCAQMSNNLYVWVCLNVCVYVCICLVHILRRFSYTRGKSYLSTAPAGSEHLNCTVLHLSHSLSTPWSLPPVEHSASREWELCRLYCLALLSFRVVGHDLLRGRLSVRRWQQQRNVYPWSFSLSAESHPPLGLPSLTPSPFMRACVCVCVHAHA